MKHFLVLMVFSTWHLVVNAMPTLNDDGVGYAGTGCPEGTATISFDSLGNLVIKPKGYTVTLNGKTFAREICDIAWAFEGRPDFKINLGNDTLSGTVKLDSSTESRLSGENFLAGQRAPRIVSSINGPKNTDFSLSIAPSGPSECGQSVIIRLNTSVELKGSAGKAAEVTVDTITIPRPTFTQCRTRSRL